MLWWHPNSISLKSAKYMWQSKNDRFSTNISRYLWSDTWCEHYLEDICDLTVTLLLTFEWTLKVVSTNGKLSMVTTTTTTTVLRPFFRDHPGDPVPEENLWTLWCTGRLTEADTLTIWMGATPSGLSSAHLHHPLFFTGRMPFLLPNQHCQSTKGN